VHGESLQCPNNNVYKNYYSVIFEEAGGKIPISTGEFIEAASAMLRRAAEETRMEGRA
jgi:hypothetical protein